jgi:hypothetical protein
MYCAIKEIPHQIKKKTTGAAVTKAASEKCFKY